MKTSKFLLVGSILVLIALSIMPVVVAGATSGPAAGSAAVVTKVVPAAQQAAALNAWTHEAFAAAKPLDTMIDYGSAKAQAPALGGLQLAAPALFSAAGVAMPGADDVARKAYAADWNVSAPQAAAAAAAAPADEFAGTSQVYTTYVANYGTMQTIYPHRWVGRLFFNTGSGGSFCSATALAENTIVTAAHCVFDTTGSPNHFYSGWVFTPAYRAGSAPYGSYAATSCTILTAWVNLSGSYTITGFTKYDVAVCRVGNNSQGQTLNNMVGWAGQTWNGGYVRHVHNLGYPFNDYRNIAIGSAGAYLRTCAAETFAYTTDTMGEGCNWGPGISGGPWLIGYAPNIVQGYVNSVNSGLYLNQQNLYGIRFTTGNFRAVWCVYSASC